MRSICADRGMRSAGSCRELVKSGWSVGFRDVTRNKEGKWEGDRRHQHKINLIKRWVYLHVAITRTLLQYFQEKTNVKR